MLLTDILVRSVLRVETTGTSVEDEVTVDAAVRVFLHSGVTVSFFSVFTFTLVCGIVVDNFEDDHGFDAIEESVETLPSGECISSCKTVHSILFIVSSTDPLSVLFSTLITRINLHRKRTIINQMYPIQWFRLSVTHPMLHVDSRWSRKRLDKHLLNRCPLSDTWTGMVC